MRRLLAILGVTLGIVVPSILASQPDAHRDAAPAPARTLASSGTAAR